MVWLQLVIRNVREERAVPWRIEGSPLIVSWYASGHNTMKILLPSTLFYTVGRLDLIE